MKSNSSSTLFAGSTVSLSLCNDSIATVKFDKSNGRVNLLSTSVLDELEKALDALESLSNLCGVIFCSGKSDSFIVGADINEIVRAQSLPSEVAFAASQRGKAVFARIAQLYCKTVAAIHGRCLGGGTELALACRYRLVSDSDKTALGLPEVGLGVLPGWGGTIRVTKLVGLVPALQLVLNPLKTWNARKAWRNGLVSEVVPETQLLERARAICLGARPKCYRAPLIERATRFITETRAGRALVSSKARAKIKKETGGKYPAVYAALHVMLAAIELPYKEALELESATFARLCKTPESAQLVKAFLQYQREKKLAAEQH